jgi:hypothetical protein
MGLRLKPRNHRGDFEVKNHQTVAAGFEAQIGKPSSNLVSRLNQETFTTGFEAKPEKTVPVVLRPNH